MKMKLYVWEGVLTDYSDGIIVAMAPDLKTARRVAIKSGGAISGRQIQNEIMKKRPWVSSRPSGAYCYGGG